MREIIFRGKDKLGIWHYGNLHIDTISDKENKHYIISTIIIDDENIPDYIEVNPYTVGQMTDSVDVNGDGIWEGNLVNQKSVLVGDNENIDFTGYVKFSEGRWVIDNGKNAISLWSEHRENKIIE